MPRGVKGSGKAVTSKKAVVGKKEKTSEKKARKAYPSSIDERILLADKKIEHLTKVIDTRNKLIQKAEKELNTRIAALVKNTDLLLKAMSRKEQLITAKGKTVINVPRAEVHTTKVKPEKVSTSKMTPEEL